MSKRNPSFVDTLKALRRGETSDELDAAITECISATELTGKTSSITVKLVIKPKGFGAFTIADDVKSTLPKFDRESTVLFTDANGNLVREDPRQQKLDLKQLDKGPSTANPTPLPTTQKSQLKNFN